MTAFQHGGGLDRAIAQYGGNKSDWLDLSTGINPNPYPVPQLDDDVWHRLPDESLVHKCLAAARSYYNVPDEAAIVAAPGTQALIQILPQLMPTKKIAIVSPTYNEYQRCYTRSGAEIIQYNSFESAAELERSIVVGNLNNPDGRAVDFEQLTAANTRGVEVIVDEAFCDVMPEKSVVKHAGLPDLLVLKSFGKFFGLAGLRLGFAIGEKRLIEGFADALGPWAVSGPALSLGSKAMRDQAWIKGARTDLNDMRIRVENMLRVNGLEVVGSTDLFVTASHVDSMEIAKLLAKNHILVRVFDYAPTWIRFGLPAERSDFARLEKALAQAL